MKSNLTRPLQLLAAATTLALAATPAFALDAFTATYQASAMGMQGNGQMTLVAQGAGKWKYDMSVRNQLVNLTQSTTFEDKDGTFRPLSSSDSSMVLVKSKSVKTNYDWSSKQATWSGDIKDNRKGPIALQPGDMDALLVNLAIVRDVHAGKPLNYRMLENGKASPMTYQAAGKETITVAGKQVSATKVSQTDGKKQMIVWVVPDMPVPARILQRENGQDSYDLTLTSFK
ncbi:Protein of unknown function [Pseudoxanthomonas sp. GM95]|uniref:DUF3108 domain-containing protein n=1 Tax=Pseudoxanthomonas sp. GM95 TaxID=1881043 RepID=UPI0008D7379C|nr:DUF3108 domain-containing protein [Pseudoxanthomonas sp. GM95]SEL76279.1 Protein of unknown function [Pseudoxanthomonas sp. GM95]